MLLEVVAVIFPSFAVLIELGTCGAATQLCLRTLLNVA